MDKKDNKQYILVDITNPDDIKSEINITGLQNQIMMIDCLSQVISQISQKSRSMADLIIGNISNCKDGEAEELIMILKQLIGNKD